MKNKLIESKINVFCDINVKNKQLNKMEFPGKDQRRTRTNRRE